MGKKQCFTDKHLLCPPNAIACEPKITVLNKYNYLDCIFFHQNKRKTFGHYL